MNGKKIIKVVTVITIAITLFFAIYIMINGLGLSDELDFGAGAYYYADIPEFDKYTEKPPVGTNLPYWVYLVIFTLWGILMYLLWKWIDRRK